MLAVTPLAVPPLYSAGDLCRAMLAASGLPASLDAAGLDRTLRHDAERGLLEVQAGVRWEALAAHVGAEFLPGSVGAAVAENCAGPDGEPMVRHLHALTLASADGELRRASRERDADLFRLAVGGFGAFGPFYSLTLDLASLARSAAMAAPPARIVLPDAGLAWPRHALELLVPPQQSDALVGQVRGALEERRCSLSLLEARLVRADASTFLRWARPEYVALRIEYATRPTLGACASAAQLRGRLIDLAIAAGGSIMPRLLPLASRPQAEACYPMLGAFLAEKRRLDPAERALSPWYRGVRRAWRAEACRVRWAKD
ncbi:MAG: FAD-binding protein [Burkholderiales bacterium]